MKFSWKLINYFINLEQIEFNKFKEKVTISGIEIEKLKSNKKNEDIVLDLNITTNRKEISSIFKLAQEVNAIFNIPIQIRNIKLKKIINSEKYEKMSNILYIKINKIYNIQEWNTPQWLIQFLKQHDITTTNLFDNIQKYIQLKWGQNFYILNIKNIEYEFNLLKLHNLENAYIKSILNKLTKHSKKKIHHTYILFSIIYKQNIKHNNKNFFENNTIQFHENAYLDTLQLISTYTGCTISRTYDKYNEVKATNQIIKTTKHEINTSLGGIKSKKLKFISLNNVNNILKQLRFKPIYNKELQLFITKIPIDRQHDIRRPIDVIEEIGRIHEFKNFFSKVQINKKKGNISNITLQTRKIRYTLRHLGLNEVINSCILSTQERNQNSINILNPNTIEQGKLRNNIVESLINNYRQSIKHRKNNIEIFEIGKVFENKYIEKKHLGGLIYNNNFLKISWSHKPEKTNILHIKGLLEIFLEQIDKPIILNTISNKDNRINIKNIEHLFSTNKKIGIYNKNNQELIGILGELNTKYQQKKGKDNEKVYIFEMNISKLYVDKNKNRHLKYIFKPYSHYPCITRDISIKIKNFNDMNEIHKRISVINQEIIESIEIFNEYKDKQSNSRFIGIRITYRAQNRTLNTKDLNNINKHLESFIL
uniref:phenylalanine--tRNA ligase n=1 Tax=Ophidocladus simpliciusculus TaxID=1261574 RepID=A0A1Z1MJT5_9FLOR|nr:Phenylalanine-tRNA ligase beta subunit [Ophidocladus simpliciusculus]ARW66085.1 Phenylalanine-tRNA ligase beta subunit [Ophidocladus simpliciusculus]